MLYLEKEWDLFPIVKTVRRKSISFSNGAWRQVIDFPYKKRSRKPRRQGVTMVIDKGMPLKATHDFLRLAAPAIDYLKLSFGTSAFYSETLLSEKIDLVHSFDVEPFPGGTLFEVAVLQNAAGRYFKRARTLGFRTIEISDGTIDLPPERRRRLILRARELGFLVLSEVGKKHPADRVPQIQLRHQIRADLENGVEKVIVEGRESGKGVVIYDIDGDIRESELESITSVITDFDALIWEAPQKSQQQDLILRFGADVNLGNIPPGEALALEAMRVGLRGDTLRAAVLSRESREKPGDG